MNSRFLLSASIAAALACGLPSLQAADAKKKATPTPAPTEKAPDPGKVPEGTKGSADASKAIPFHGKVTAVDPAGKSFSIKGAAKDRMFAVTDKTAIVGKDNAPAKASAIPVGEEVRGNALKNGDNWTAVKVYIGAKAPEKGKEKTAEKPADKPTEKPGTPGKAAEPAKKAQ